MAERDPDSPSASSGLLAAGDPPPVVALNEGARSPFLLLGDHAGRAVPARLGDLDVSPADMDRHIAWDIGVAELGARLSRALGAVFVRQTYSRLVIDCNRRLGADGSIPPISDGTPIPGNLALSVADVAARQDEIYHPYQDKIARVLDGRGAQETVLVALHSFTPFMQGQARPWRFGVLHRGDSPFSRAMLALMKADLGDLVGDNQPYAMDGTDNTVPLHADPRGLDYLEIEVRQDLLIEPKGCAAVARWLADLLPRALAPRR